ncbi:MAG: hypothetical protein AB1425_11075 [Actinomycetota bacterium]
MREVWENLATTLEGSVVRLEPLGSRHERGLFEAARKPGAPRAVSEPGKERR